MTIATIGMIVGIITVVFGVVGLIFINRMTGRQIMLWAAVVLAGGVIYFALTCNHIQWVGKYPICICS